MKNITTYDVDALRRDRLEQLRYMTSVADLTIWDARLVINALALEAIEAGASVRELRTAAGETA